MKRRDFIKTTAVTGVSGFLGQGCSVLGKRYAPMELTSPNTGPGFDVHPFLKNHPDAVFIQLTDVKEKNDSEDIRSAGQKLASELIVKVSSGGYPYSTKINVKPNWTSAGPKDGKPVNEKLGVCTDPYFVEGWVQGMRKVGPQDYYIRECCCPQQWEPMGWRAMCDRSNIDLRDLTSMDYWELKDGDLNFLKIPDGVVFDEVGYMAPMNEPDTFLVNIAKMKTHGKGVTASIKNLQGITARRFHSFCTGPHDVMKRMEQPYHKFFKKDFEKHVVELHAGHMKQGYPRWDNPGPADNRTALNIEQWCQRMLDSLSMTPTALNMVEGIYSQDGNGFGIGPHEKLGPNGVTSRDYMSNMVIFGRDPFRVDIITHWLAGHEPGNFGLFHIGIERGFSDVLDPRDIPVYMWKDGQPVLSKLDSFKRTPLLTYYLPKDFSGQTEPYFHLCNEPFDYTAWKKRMRVSDRTPSIRTLGRDGNNNVVLEVAVPKRGNISVDVYNGKGNLVTRLAVPDIEPGVHQVVWDGISTPGLHHFHLSGMGWDAVTRDIILS